MSSNVENSRMTQVGIYGTLGAAAGAGIGFLVAGPGGAIAGMTAGGTLGTYIGGCSAVEKEGKDWSAGGRRGLEKTAQAVGECVLKGVNLVGCVILANEKYIPLVVATTVAYAVGDHIAQQLNTPDCLRDEQARSADCFSAVLASGACKVAAVFGVCVTFCVAINDIGKNIMQRAGIRPNQRNGMLAIESPQ